MNISQGLEEGCAIGCCHYNFPKPRQLMPWSTSHSDEFSSPLGLNWYLRIHKRFSLPEFALTLQLSETSLSTSKPPPSQGQQCCALKLCLQLIYTLLKTDILQKQHNSSMKGKQHVPLRSLNVDLLTSINWSKAWYSEIWVTFKHHFLWLFSVKSQKFSVLVIQEQKFKNRDCNTDGLRQDSGCFWSVWLL